MTTDLVIRPFDDLEAQVFDALNMVQSGVATPEQWLIDALGGGSRSASGAIVNVQSIMGIPAAWNSINMIAGHIACLPKELRRKLPGGGSQVVDTLPAHHVMNTWCSDLYTPFTFWQTTMVHALIQGNGRAFISRDGNGAPSRMTLMLPNAAYTITVNGKKWHVVYFTNDMYGDVVSPELAEDLAPFHTGMQTGGAGYQYTIPDEEVFHTPGLGYDGLWGYPLSVVAKDTFGVEQSGLGAVSYQFNNSGRPGLILTAPKGMFRTSKEADEFMAQFRGQHEGQQNAGRTCLLREGIEAETLPPVAADTGLSSLRERSQEDIALLFGTEYLLGHSSAVYKDLASRMSAYVTNTLSKWMETIEQEANRKLLTDSQYRRQGLYFEVDPFRLLRGNLNDVATYTGQLRQQGLVNGDEGRRYHNLNPAGLTDYDNPNISTSEDDEPVMPDSNENETEARLRQAVECNFRALIDHEQTRIRRYAKQEDFLARAEKFYKTFEKKLAVMCDDLGIPRERATEYIEQSQDQLLEVCGVVAPSQIPDAVSGMVEGWTERAREFTYENV